MELLKFALEIISRECSAHSRCEQCPLEDPGRKGRCMINNENVIPEDWVIKHEEKECEESLFV